MTCSPCRVSRYSASRTQLTEDNVGIIKRCLTKGPSPRRSRGKDQVRQKQAPRSWLLDLRLQLGRREEEGVAVANLFQAKGTIGIRKARV